MSCFKRRLFRARIIVFPSLLLALLALPRCQTVPATGESRLSLISTAEEIRIGRDADSQISSTMGIYENEPLEIYVRELGLRMAAVSERPQLPWSFRILDDDVVNAFALPGGFIYVTRGILAHCNSEAELAGIIGHEIGHVTARHSVIKLSRMQLTQLGFGLLEQALPESEGLGMLAGIGTQLLFLKFSREDELQADELGVRYMVRIGEDPRSLIDVMAMLERVSLAQGGGTMPQWLSTHPTPGNRQANLAELIEPLDESAFNPVDMAGYVRRLDGLVYGKNPRQGYTEGDLFLHPELRFQLRFPGGWQISNQKTMVTAVSPDQQAAIRLSLAEASSVQAAADDFFASPGILAEGGRSVEVHGNPGRIGDFTLQTDQGPLRGTALFVEYGRRIYQIVGYGTAAAWAGLAPGIRDCLLSFAELTDPAALSVQPLRLQIVSPRPGTTLRSYYEQRGSPLALSELVLLNRLEADEQIPDGRLIKWVAKAQR
jgi:predicted Zn-dependent protease